MNQILPRSTPEAEGISSAVLRQFVEAIRGLDSVHSVMVMRHGRVIAEGWGRPYAPEVPHMLFSLSKSFTSCAVGFACAEGKLSLDTRLVDLFHDKLSERIDPKFETMRIRHLLSMESGHDHWTKDDMLNTPDWERAFFRTTLAYEPGTHFCYNGGASYMLAAAVVHVSGESLCDYLRPRLFTPLGIAPRLWELSPQGIETGGWGFNLTTEEIASFAQCLLDGGRRDGRQVIPEEYLRLATSVQSDSSTSNNQPDCKAGYGFHFWRCRHNAFRGDGAFGQYAIAMPEQDMALAITSGARNMYQILDQVWEFLLPGAGESALPPAPGEVSALRNELETWALPVLSSTGAELPKRRYLLDDNELHFRILEFTSFEDHVELTLDGETLQAGFGYQADNLLSWGEPLPRRVAASVRRISDREFELLAYCYETPFHWSFRLDPGTESVTLARTANLCFRTADWPVLTGLRQS